MERSVIRELADYGQSIWIDNINRSLINDGKVNEMINMGLRGMTSNPTIFDKAISNSNAYDKEIEKLYQGGKTIFEIYDELTVKDIQSAADIFSSVYQKTNKLDGYVSLEINPQLAYKVQETIDEGKRLHKKVSRPNLMLKVPATAEGFEAVIELIACGINVNVTLIFSLEQYVKTVKAYIKGLDRLLKNGGNLDTVHSVASVFVSRVDNVVDKLLAEKISNEDDSAATKELNSFVGRAAVSNVGLIYGRFLGMFGSGEFKELKKKGANIQRALWASTSTKNPNYSDTKYVTELITKNTVNTLPEVTFEAFSDHGDVKEAMTSDTGEAVSVINGLRKYGVEINDVCDELLDKGVTAFEKSFESLLASIQKKASAICKD